MNTAVIKDRELGDADPGFSSSRDPEFWKLWKLFQRSPRRKAPNFHTNPGCCFDVPFFQKDNNRHRCCKFLQNLFWGRGNGLDFPVLEFDAYQNGLGKKLTKPIPSQDWMRESWQGETPDWEKMKFNPGGPQIFPAPILLEIAWKERFLGLGTQTPQLAPPLENGITSTDALECMELQHITQQKWLLWLSVGIYTWAQTLAEKCREATKQVRIIRFGTYMYQICGSRIVVM